MKNSKTVTLLVVVFFSCVGLQAQCDDFFSQLDGTNGTPDHSETWTGICDGQYPSPIHTAEQATPPMGTCSPAFTHRGQDASYGLVIGGNMTIPDGGGSEYEGKMAVRGDFLCQKTSGNYGVSQCSGGAFVIGADDATGGPSLSVGGDISITSGSFIEMGFNNPGATYAVEAGGTISGTISGGGTASVTTSSGVTGITATIDNILNPMEDVSLEMSTTAATGTVDFTSNWNARFTGTNAPVEVFNVTADQIDADGTSVRFLEFEDIAPNATIVINVSGTTVEHRYTALAGRIKDNNLFDHDTPGFETDTSAVIFNLVWNFYEATSLQLPSSLDLIGLSLAPQANVELTGADIYGRLYVGGNLTHSSDDGDIYNYPFKGDLSGFCPATPLPVEMGDFTATYNAQHAVVELEWETYSEEGNDYFDVEFSTDGRLFDKVGDVQGRGYSVERTEYGFLHEVDRLAGPVLYYRLKQVDYDGSYEYSKIVSVYLLDAYQEAVEVFPTHCPLGQNLNIHAKYSTPFWLSNTAGRVVREGLADPKAKVNTAGLPQGLYFLFTPNGVFRVFLG